MKNKPLSEVEQAVETFVAVDCAVTYEVFTTGEQIRDGNWKCDGWRFAIKGQSFEYFTGTGHREEVNADIRRRAAFGFPGLTEKDRKYQTAYGQRYLEQVEKMRKPQTPPIAGLLHSLILDGSACDESFSSWCDNFGYDVDSRKALATYEACQQGFDKVRKVFTGAQIEHIRELLQDY